VSFSVCSSCVVLLLDLTADCVLLLRYFFPSLFLHCSPPHPALHSFPTRRSSDLRIMNANIAEYHMPVNADVHDIQVIFVEEEDRSEEHTSELQSLAYLVCRLLLEKKKKKIWRRQQNTDEYFIYLQR